MATEWTRGYTTCELYFQGCYTAVQALQGLLICGGTSVDSSRLDHSFGLSYIAYM
jgi:hypothetical protein